MAAPTAKRVPKVDFREAVSSFQTLDNRNLTHRHVIDGRQVLSFYIRRETQQVYDSIVSSVPKAREEQAVKARESMSVVAAREAQMKLWVDKHYLEELVFSSVSCKVDDP